MMHRTCMGLCICLLLAAPMTSAEEEGVKPGPYAAATRLIQEQVESGLVGAAALLVAHNGKIEVEQGFGSLSRKAGAKPCKSDSIFLVASISKPVTAMAVMTLGGSEANQLGRSGPKVFAGVYGRRTRAHHGSKLTEPHFRTTRHAPQQHRTAQSACAAEKLRIRRTSHSAALPPRIARVLPKHGHSAGF